MIAAQNDFLRKEEEETRARKDEIDLPPTESEEEEESDDATDGVEGLSVQES